ncbi:MAG: ATP-binding protein [Deltaproteobacteria bacterium]|nr:ATP-binding protein [Deltaproteobacteria bacterium]
MNLNNLAMIEEQNLRLREENELLRRALSETDCGYRLIQQRDEFAKLIDFGKTIVAELNINKIFALVAEKARELISAELLIIPIIDANRETYTYLAAAGPGSADILNATLKIGVGMCGWVLQNERPLLFGESDEWWMDEKTRWEKGQQSALLVPLMGKKQIIGGLSGIGKVGGGSFSVHDLDVLTLFANQVSAAIENARLFQEGELKSNALTISNQRLQEEIQERLQAEAALAAERERLAVTLRSIGDGVIATDTEKKIVALNKIAEELTGWSLHEALGRPFEEVFQIINEQTRQSREHPVDKVLTSGQIIGLANHTILVAKDGTERSIADSAAPIRDEKSRIIGVVLVFRDVTERNRIEKELHKVQKLESVGLLAGGIAHDFNNILAAILGNLSLSLLDKGLSGRTRDFLREAEKASWRARDLTQQLLTFSKGGAPIKEVSSLDEVIKDSANFVLSGKQVTCQFSFSDDLWLVEIDKGQISQVIQNIVLNASQAIVGSGIISIACCNAELREESKFIGPREGKYVKISIRDNGSGIPASVVDKIFDPYFSTRKEGSGLGLAITHAIIAKHGGQIYVTSELGVGTTFTIYLPASSKSETSAQEQVALSPVQRKTNILIMDDDEMLRDVAKAMLTSLGHEVMLAADGNEAIEVYKKSGNTIDLIIMDLTIPGGMGGKDAVGEILKLNPAAKVVVSSGYSNDPIMARFGEYGFCAALVKPYQLSDFTKVINQLIQ